MARRACSWWRHAIATLPETIRAKEYQRFDTSALSGNNRARLNEKAASTAQPEDSPKTLGLHLKNDEDKTPSPHAWSYVGQVWLDLENERLVLRVNPKTDAAAFQMYVACVGHPSVRGHLDQCISIFWNEPPIPVDGASTMITPLVIMRFLVLLYDLCQRHLRATITTDEANLTGRIRGKPLIQPTLRMNHGKGRLDRTYCRFQVQSIDNVANQILAAALHQAAKYINRDHRSDRDLLHLAAFSASALSGVTLRRILPTDFHGPSYSGFQVVYREPHRWARLVLQLLGSDPLEEIRRKEIRRTEMAIQLPPFAINMNELFERYCEVVLRRAASQEVWAGYSGKDRNLGDQFQVRPDFVVKTNCYGCVADAKYKTDWSWKNDQHRADVFQVVSYSQHKEVRAKLGKLDFLVVLYPADGHSGRSELNLHDATSGAERLDAFEIPLFRVPVKLPCERRE